MDALQPDETENPQIVNLSQAKVETIQAGLVRANQSTINHVKADEVDLQTSAAGSIQTGELHAQDSILGMISTSQAQVVDSITGVIRSESLNFNGVTALAVANDMLNEEVKAIAVIATKVKADNINTGILISREIYGNVTTTLDGQTALIAGLAGGAMLGLILLAGKLLFGRKN
jgi:hypothetical protein